MRPYDISAASFLAEAIFLLIFVNFLIAIYRRLYQIYNHPRMQELTECDEELRGRDFFTRALNYPVDEIHSVAQGVYILGDRVYMLTQRILRTILIFSETHTLFVFHLVSIILTIIGVLTWANVVRISYDPRLSLDNMLKTKSGDLERDILNLVRTATR